MSLCEEVRAREGGIICRLGFLSLEATNSYTFRFLLTSIFLLFLLHYLHTPSYLSRSDSARKKSYFITSIGRYWDSYGYSSGRRKSEQLGIYKGWRIQLTSNFLGGVSSKCLSCANFW